MKLPYMEIIMFLLDTWLTIKKPHVMNELLILELKNSRFQKNPNYKRLFIASALCSPELDFMKRPLVLISPPYIYPNLSSLIHLILPVPLDP